jgi:hypothetical protein
MKYQKMLLLRAAVLSAALTMGMGLRAATVQTATMLNAPGTGGQTFEFVAFRDSAEANMLRDAYRILATGDHDYNGHRVKAMHAVEEAAKLLGMDVSGDLKDRSPQPLSDDKLREAQGLIAQVLGSAEVKGQKRVVKHLNQAVKHINVALNIR